MIIKVYTKSNANVHKLRENALINNGESNTSSIFIDIAHYDNPPFATLFTGHYCQTAVALANPVSFWRSKIYVVAQYELDCLSAAREVCLLGLSFSKWVFYRQGS
jgi:hypothetical protein